MRIHTIPVLNKIDFIEFSIKVSVSLMHFAVDINLNL